MNAPPRPPLHVLMLVGDTIGKVRRTGIQRVVVETAGALSSSSVRFDLVRWDLVEGRLRFLDQDELNGVFGPGAWPEGVVLRPEARRIGRPFREQLDDPLDTWLLVAEVAWHEQDGVELMARAMAHCRQWGGRSAAVFYDLIPIRNPVYAGGAEAHEAYLAELAKADLIIPISRTAGEDLANLWRERRVAPHPPIVPLLLPDGGFGRRRGLPPTSSERQIVMFGTVEPRKRQVEFLEAMEQARRKDPETARWQVVVIGSVHGHVAQRFDALLRRSPWITHLDYVADAALAEIMSNSAFSVFASDDEGYGLPIAESLAAGLPCLCANFGSMAEIADGGGCLTIDVRQAEAMEAAAIELCGRPQTLDRLRCEIAVRQFRSWDDYARLLVDAMAKTPRPSPDAGLQIEAAGPDEATDFERLAAADIAVFADRSGLEAFVADARRRHWPALLPPTALAADAGALAERLKAQAQARLAVADMERAFARARQGIAAEHHTRAVFLRVLISTYNRRDFVLANVRWILRKVFHKAAAPVEVVVVDGGSTDGTVESLYKIADPRLKIIECPVNVGMLAGLREAARVPGAEYVWLVGDDDFMDPRGFADIVCALQANAGAPFAFTNFSVYHRAALGPADSVGRLAVEGRPVAEDVAPSGLMTVREAAAQTDNLFTAIYAIVWRADLLSAAYEHAFDGAPFHDLTEAIPCTEFILGRYGACDAYWHAEPGITGNAHNSWSRHRPRWHAVIMPMALDLARAAGVDPVRLQAWADHHRALLDEALQMTGPDGPAPAFGSENADLAFRVFRDHPPGFASP